MTTSRGRSQAYSVGNTVYGSGRSNPTSGTVDPTGYVERGANNMASQRRSRLAQAAMSRQNPAGAPLDAMGYQQHGTARPQGPAGTMQRMDMVPNPAYSAVNSSGGGGVPQGYSLVPPPPQFSSDAHIRWYQTPTGQTVPGDADGPFGVNGNNDGPFTANAAGELFTPRPQDIAGTDAHRPTQTSAAYSGAQNQSIQNFDPIARAFTQTGLSSAQSPTGYGVSPDGVHLNAQGYRDLNNPNNYNASGLIGGMQHYGAAPTGAPGGPVGGGPNPAGMAGLPFDEEYEQGVIGLGRGKTNYAARIAEMRQQIESGAFESSRGLQDQQPNALKDILENFAGRGMAHSSRYAGSVGEQNALLASRLAEITRGKTNSLNDSYRDEADFNSEYQNAMDQLKLARARRAAENPALVTTPPAAPVPGAMIPPPPGVAPGSAGDSNFDYNQSLLPGYFDPGGAGYGNPRPGQSVTNPTPPNPHSNWDFDQAQQPGYNLPGGAGYHAPVPVAPMAAPMAARPVAASAAPRPAAAAARPAVPWARMTQAQKNAHKASPQGQRELAAKSRNGGRW